MMAHDEYDLQPPYLKGFVIILPEGVAIQDQTTWGFETDELEPLLDGSLLIPVESCPAPLPTDGVGRNFVSLRFWQVDDEEESPFAIDLKHLFKAFERVHPPVDRNSASSVPVDTVTGLTRHRTIVEAVTFVASADDLVATATKPDPLTRCLDALFDFHRAYRVIASAPTDQLTYSQLFPLVLTFRRSLENSTVLPDGFMHLSSDNVQFGALTSQIGSVDLDHVAVSLSRLRLGDPLMSFVERRIDARYEQRVKGNYGAAVLQLAIACEVILDALLGMVLWESGATDIEAAKIFSSDITPRLRNEYACRLGGNWALNTGGLAGWNDNVAGLRNRVVHGGYKPTGGEVQRSQESVDALAKFVSDCLFMKTKIYPKTAWLFLGPDGYESRNGYSRRVREWIETQPESAVLDWIREYTEWRRKVNDQVQLRRKSSP